MKTPKEIKKILDAASKSGSVHLTGTRDERIQQLRELRAVDIAEENLKRGDNSTDTQITGRTSSERRSSLRSILDKQKKGK